MRKLPRLSARILWGESLDLIETLAVRIAQNILDECAYVHALEVTVNKTEGPGLR